MKLRHKLMGAILFAAFFNQTSQAIVNLGEKVPNMCFKDASSKTHCLDDYKNNIRILIFNAGWCSPCKSHMSSLAPKVKEFNGKPVVFISVSANGWSNGSYPDSNFLKQWKSNYNISFPVLASSWTDLYQFYYPSAARIPSDIIVDAKGNLHFKGINPGTTAVFSKVRNLLSSMP